MLSLIWAESSVSSDYSDAQSDATNGENDSCYLAEEFIDIPMVLSHPFNEVVKLLDEITDLSTRSQRYPDEERTTTCIVTAEVEALGPRKD